MIDLALERHKRRLKSDPKYAKMWKAFEKRFWVAMCQGIVKEQEQIIKEHYV